MESLSSVSRPSIVLPPSNHVRQHHHHRRRRISAAHPMHHHRLSSLSSFLSIPCSPEPCGRRIVEISCKSAAGGPGRDEEEDDDGNDEYGRDDEVERALRLDGTIPGTSNEFVERVSSRAYDMRRHLQQTFDSSSYDGAKWRSGIKNQAKQSRTGTKFQMLVEDVREGVLVFEDQNEAAKYCDLLEGGGQGCEGVAEIEASSVFDLCQKMRALAVLFRRGRTPPLPESLKLNLKARKRSLEDQEDII